MRVWIDNTGLHSAGQCLVRRARGNYDVDGLLQLGTLLIFAETLVVNGFESDPVAAKTREIQDRLMALGLPPSALQVTAGTEGDYRSACDEAADLCAADLPDVSFQQDMEPASLKPVGLPDGVSSPWTSAVTEVIDSGSTDRLAELRERALAHKAAGAVAYMLASSPSLRRSVAASYGQQCLGGSETEPLVAFCRYCLNDVLARRHSGVYSPSVSRAKLIRRQNVSVVNRLTDVVDDAVRQLHGHALGLPSVAMALVQRSGGDPEGVVSAALEFRLRAADLRKWVGSQVGTADELTPSGLHRAYGRIREVADVLQSDLGLKPKPRLWHALEIHFVLGLPAPSLSGRKLVEWINYRWKRRRAAVLTEMSALTAYAGREVTDYRRLAKACQASGA